MCSTDERRSACPVNLAVTFFVKNTLPHTFRKVRKSAQAACRAVPSNSFLSGCWYPLDEAPLAEATLLDPSDLTSAEYACFLSDAPWWHWHQPYSSDQKSCQQHS